MNIRVNVAVMFFCNTKCIFTHFFWSTTDSYMMEKQPFISSPFMETTIAVPALLGMLIKPLHFVMNFIILKNFYDFKEINNLVPLWIFQTTQSELKAQAKDMSQFLFNWNGIQIAFTIDNIRDSYHLTLPKIYSNVATHIFWILH